MRTKVYLGSGHIKQRSTPLTSLNQPALCSPLHERVNLVHAGEIKFLVIFSKKYKLFFTCRSLCTSSREMKVLQLGTLCIAQLSESGCHVQLRKSLLGIF